MLPCSIKINARLIVTVTRFSSCSYLFFPPLSLLLAGAIPGTLGALTNLSVLDLAINELQGKKYTERDHQAPSRSQVWTVLESVGAMESSASYA